MLFLQILLDVFVSELISARDITRESFEFFQIEFYRIYRIYRICRKLFLVIFIFKITKISILQNIQILWKTIFSTFNFLKQLKIVFYKFYRFCRFYRILFGKNSIAFACKMMKSHLASQKQIRQMDMCSGPCFVLRFWCRHCTKSCDLRKWYKQKSQFNQRTEFWLTVYSQWMELGLRHGRGKIVLFLFCIRFD